MTKYEYSLNKNNESNALKDTPQALWEYAQRPPPRVVEPYLEIKVAEYYQLSVRVKKCALSDNLS